MEIAPFLLKYSQIHEKGSALGFGCERGRLLEGVCIWAFYSTCINGPLESMYAHCEHFVF